MNWQIQDPVLIFAVILLILLIAPLLFARLKVPGLIGLIVAGVLAGPHALGWFSDDGTFQLLGKVGLLYLMFLAGFEIEFNEFARHRRDSIVFGVLTFIIPQVLGALAARALFRLTWPQSILLASLFASHTLIPLPMVARLGLMRHRVVATTVGGTILTDTAALLVLAVIAESVSAAPGAGFWVVQAALLGVLVFFGLWALPRIGYWFFRVAAPDETAEFLFVLAAAFATSYLAHLCRVEPILGAFLAGLALNRLVPASSPLMNRIEFVGNALFIPFFLISVGMKVNLSVALQWRSWAMSAFMIATVTATKWLAAEAGGRALRYSADERGLMFGLSVNQAAATLAAVLVGVRLGLFDDNILNGTILMMLATCILGPWMTHRHGERLAVGEAISRPTPRGVQRVIVPLAHPESANALVDLALLLRGRSTEPIYPLAVAQDGIGIEERLEAAERTLGRAAARAAAAGAPVVPVTEIDTTIAGGIVRAIREYRASAVVMGWSRRYASPVSVLHWLPREVLERTRTLLVLARIRRPIGSLRRALCIAPLGLEHTPGFDEMLRAALQIAALTELHLFAPPESIQRLRDVAAKARGGGPVIAHPTPEETAWPEALASVRPSAQDVVLVLMARPGCLGWRPRDERLPPRVADTFPETDFLLLYPPLPEEGADAALNFDAATNSDSERLLSPAAVRTDVPGGDIERTLSDLLATVMGDHARAVEAARRLAGQEASALTPDIALLHGHEMGFGESRVFVAICREGFSLNGVVAPRRVVFTLVSDSALPPASHLRALAIIARAVQSDAFRRTLTPGTAPAEIVRAFRAANADRPAVRN